MSYTFCIYLCTYVYFYLDNSSNCLGLLLKPICISIVCSSANSCISISVPVCLRLCMCPPLLNHIWLFKMLYSHSPYLKNGCMLHGKRVGVHMGVHSWTKHKWPRDIPSSHNTGKQVVAEPLCHLGHGVGIQGSNHKDLCPFSQLNVEHWVSTPLPSRPLILIQHKVQVGVQWLKGTFIEVRRSENLSRSSWTTVATNFTVSNVHFCTVVTLLPIAHALGHRFECTCPPYPEWPLHGYGVYLGLASQEMAGTLRGHNDDTSSTFLESPRQLGNLDSSHTPCATQDDAWPSSWCW